jgi:hypothetical protein
MTLYQLQLRPVNGACFYIYRKPKSKNRPSGKYGGFYFVLIFLK